MTDEQYIRLYKASGPEVLYRTCVAMKFVDDDDDDDDIKFVLKQMDLLCSCLGRIMVKSALAVPSIHPISIGGESGRFSQ